MKIKKEVPHTPTPWKLRKTGNLDIISNSGHVVYLGPCKDADAEFIVRAVNSYEALLSVAEECLMWLEAQQHLYGLTESGARKYQDNVDNIKKAIKQAAGNK